MRGGESVQPPERPAPPYYGPQPYYGPPAYYPGYGYPQPYPHAFAPPPIPRPRGVPTRAPFIIGAVGSFFAAGMSIAFGVLNMFAFWSPTPFFFTLGGLIAGVILGVAVLLQLLGFHGMWRNYGSRMGAASMVYGFAAVAVFLLASLLGTLAVQMECNWGWCFAIVAWWGWALLLTAYAMMGALFIVQGTAFIVNRHFLGSGGAPVATGVLLIIAGSFLASFLLAVFGGFFVLAPAMIVGGIVLARARLPLMPMQALPRVPTMSPPAQASFPPVGPPGPYP